MSQKTKSKKKQRTIKRPARRVDSVKPLRSQPYRFPGLGLKPVPRDTESLEDRAVFTKSIREQLPDERRIEAEAVAAAIELVSSARFASASQGLKSISRSSPFADWRLFVRGLVSLYEGDASSARQAWSRLDVGRRPARIANTLWIADTGESIFPEMQTPDESMVEASRQLRERREAIAAARQIATEKHRDNDTSFSASQVSMLAEFRDDYRKLAPQFADEFSQACVRLASFQPHANIFEMLQSRVPGPPNDPRWNMELFIYLTQFAGSGDEMSLVAAKFIDGDLPKLTFMPTSLRDALASSIWVAHAEHLQHDQAQPMFGIFGAGPDYDPIDDSLRSAVERYPLNRKAHEERIALLEMCLDNDGLSKPEVDEVKQQLADARSQFVESFPREVEASLWLVDYYLDQDDLDRVQSLSEKLSDQRLDAPMAKALPWKLQLREAMQASRRKSKLGDARSALDAAESVWPNWLRPDWLAFLRAAIELRAGDKSAFERLAAAARQQCDAPDWVADVMSFAALQQMNLPATELKPYRAIMKQHEAVIADRPLGELFALGSFFWDLTRTGMRHKGYRLQASRYGKTLCGRLDAGEHFDPQRENFFDACDWLASHRFWRTGYGDASPAWLDALAKEQPRAALAIVSWLVARRYNGYGLQQHSHLIDAIAEYAKAETNPFDRHRFARLANEAQVSLAEWNSRSPSPMMSFFGADEYDDDEDDFDDAPCDCPACRAERGELPLSGLDEDTDDEDWLDDDKADLESMPPAIRDILRALGPERAAKMAELVAEIVDDDDPMRMVEALIPLFADAGLSPGDLVTFLKETSSAGGELADFDSDEMVPSTPAVPARPQTASERRESRRTRQKSLQKKKKRRK